MKSFNDVIHAADILYACTECVLCFWTAGGGGAVPSHLAPLAMHIWDLAVGITAHPAASPAALERAAGSITQSAFSLLFCGSTVYEVIANMVTAVTPSRDQRRRRRSLPPAAKPRRSQPRLRQRAAAPSSSEWRARCS